MGLSSAGIGSGLDVTTIVNQLMTAEQAPLNALTAKQTENQSKLTAYGTILSGLSGLQSTLKKLSDVQQLQAVTTTSADNTIVSATGGAGAVPGDYAIEVTQVAQAQKLATSGQANMQAVIGTGVLSFDFGTISGGTLSNGQYTGATFTNNGGASKTVTIDASNNTLSGIRDAINAANMGVSATIVNDGSSSPYRLSLSNKLTGESNSMKISVSGDSALQTLLKHDPASNSGQALTQSVAQR
jgi:flagellar hook-associated protein 2